MQTKLTDSTKKIKDLLAKQLGTEAEDIDEDDSLTRDLFMKASDLTDFLESLEGAGFETSTLDLTEVETVGELIDKLADEF